MANGQKLVYDWDLIGESEPLTNKRVLLDDETLRDGLQSPTVSDPPIEDKIHLLHLMEDLGIQMLDIGLPGAGPRAKADSLALAQDMNRIAEEDGLHPRVLIEVNMAGEGSKFGFQPEKLRAEMESLLALPRLSMLGLMAIPPIAEEAEASRKYFVELRELRDRLQTEFHVDLAQLSMGMTQDYAIAAEEGATLVRVGTAIFGERTRKKE